jgi:hypothetical protein
VLRAIAQPNPQLSLSRESCGGCAIAAACFSERQPAKRAPQAT